MNRVAISQSSMYDRTKKKCKMYMNSFYIFMYNIKDMHGWEENSKAIGQTTQFREQGKLI